MIPRWLRGSGQSRPTWQQQLLQRGWATRKYVPTSIQPDNGAGLVQGIIGLANHGSAPLDGWGALRAWAWGASRVLDTLKPTPQSMSIRSHHRHQRYGKAALVAWLRPAFCIAYISSSEKRRPSSTAIVREEMATSPSSEYTGWPATFSKSRRHGAISRPTRTSSSPSARTPRLHRPARNKKATAGDAKACSSPQLPAVGLHAAWQKKIWEPRSFPHETGSSPAIWVSASTPRHTPARTGDISRFRQPYMRAASKINRALIVITWAADCLCAQVCTR